MQLKEQINKIELICKENKIKIYRDFQATCASANFTDAAYKVLRDKLVPNIYNILYNEFNGKGKIKKQQAFKKSIFYDVSINVYTCVYDTDRRIY